MMKHVRLALFMAAGVAALGSFATGSEAQQARTLIVAAPQTPTGFDGDIAKVATRQMVVQTYEGLVRYKRMTGADGRAQLDAREVERTWPKAGPYRPTARFTSSSSAPGSKVRSATSFRRTT